MTVDVYRSDFVYMVPPFFAVSTQNASVLNMAIQQIIDYRAILKTDSGVWSHISASGDPDADLWSTGNGWAAMGITRVWATACYTSAQNSQTDTLKGWVKEINVSASK